MRRVMVIGTGKRVRETALPALHRARGAFEVVHVLAKRAKEIEVDGRRYAVRAADALDAAMLAEVDLVYVAVKKDAVPAVLARLAALDVGGAELLIDTPVVRVKHFRHAALARAFRAAWVAEDCVHLPWIAPAREAIAAGAIGALEGVLFHRSAYAYHGVATARAVLGEGSVRRARRRKIGGGFAQRDLLFERGGEAWIVEPRDYAQGRVAVIGSAGSISDAPSDVRAPHLRLSVVLAGSDVVALALGDRTYAFDADEVELLRGDPPALGLTARMEAQKRVAFLRLLRAIDRGEGGHPLDDALEDTVVDYALERLGRYRATPWTDPRRPLARALFGLLSRAGG